jgi:ubiquinone/menaquinone biosynthesis C-methylase UbiE
VSNPNAQYNLAEPDSLPVRIAAHARRGMFECFLRTTNIAREETLLDVGATSDQTYEASNYVEAWYPYKDRVTAVGIDDASFLEQRYPGMTFKRASGLELPFEDGSFDVVHSSAVIEHVGSAANQRRFIEELTRVARRAVFITTPNRWYPVEFHTVLPLVHWLPKGVFRGLLARTRLHFFAREENLNLLSGRELRNLAAGVPGRIELRSHRLLGWTSNLLLVIHKSPRNAAA